MLLLLTLQIDRQPHVGLHNYTRRCLQLLIEHLNIVDLKKSILHSLPQTMVVNKTVN